MNASASDSAGVGLLLLDRRGIPRYANRAARAVFSWTNGALPAASLLEVQPFLQVVEHCRADRAHECHEYIFERGGKIYKIFGRAASSGFCIALPDITHEKEAERVKTEFVALASHQLRTPLSIMKWTLEQHPDRSRWRAKVEKAIEQMIALVGDLLNVARLESGKLVPAPVAMDVRTLVKHVFEEFLPTLKIKRIARTLTLGARPVPVLVDPKFMHEILTNLISNAVKYTPPRGRVGVRAAVRGREAVITVRDTGVGIPDRETRHIFEKFFRGENVAGTEIEGTGLGLHVAERMAQAMGGSITFHSKEGAGSTFMIVLPLHTATPL